MSEPNTESDDRLHSVILSYLQEVDAGRPPDPEEIVARHPDLADDLRAFFTNQRELKPLLEPLQILNPAAPEAVSTTGYGDPGAGEPIRPYKLLQKLGEGGMGTVWMADQEEPVRRRVALKIIKAGLDSAHVIARFEQERQALAMMEHPNIAKVLDAGTIGEPSRVSDRVLEDDTRRLTPLGSPGRPYLSWNSSRAFPSPNTATRRSSHRRSGCGCSCRYARRCSTRIRRASFTAT